MDESLQQLLALVLVALAVGLELLRRRRKQQRGKVGCEGCSTNAADTPPAEAPVKFYKRP